jgi:hypothetical protein
MSSIDSEVEDILNRANFLALKSVTKIQDDGDSESDSSDSDDE